MDNLDKLLEAVQANSKYHAIDPALVRRLGAAELAKGRGFKEAVKAVRNKLHQVGGAYQETPPDYPAWLDELTALPRDLHHPAVLDFCRRCMAHHASTRERLPELERFYREALASIAPLLSIVDVACGLNPLALPWMPLAAEAVYFGCDVYADMVGFGSAFLSHMGITGEVSLCDLTASIPAQPAQVALALKTLPCLEQIDKSIGPRLLDGLNAEHLLVSFPARSLGGRGKGMPAFYEAHLRELLAGQEWDIQRFEYPSELAFLLHRR